MNIMKPHVSLNVRNIQASIDFYSRAFGVTPTKVRPGYAKFDLEAPSLNLTMQEAPRTGVNASHFGVQVASTDDVGVAKRNFEDRGLKTFTEENVACCYAVQDKVWVEDPDGNAWEVFVVKADADVMKGTDTRNEQNSLGAAPAVTSAEKNQTAPCCEPGCCVPNLTANAG